MQKYRVYELAKMLGKTNEEIITTLQKNNINVKTNFNSVGEKEKELLENVFKPQDSKKPAQNLQGKNVIQHVTAPILLTK